MLASVVRQANLTYAGGQNQTRINGLGTKDVPTIATYFNSGASHPGPPLLSLCIFCVQICV